MVSEVFLDQPLISIIVPLYNRQGAIARAIESLLGQTYSNWELIIVDDASTDNSVAKVLRYTDPRITLLRRTVNSGYLSARNAGLSIMRGEWFGFLDSDDELTPCALESVVHVFINVDPTINVVRGGKLDLEAGCHANTRYTPGLISPMTMYEGETWYVIRSNLLGAQRFIEGARWGDGELWMRLLPYMKQYYIEETLYVWHTEGEDRLSNAVSDRHAYSKYETYALILDVNPSFFLVRRGVGLPDILPGVIKQFLENGDLDRALRSAEMLYRAEHQERIRYFVTKCFIEYLRKHSSERREVLRFLQDNYSSRRYRKRAAMERIQSAEKVKRARRISIPYEETLFTSMGVHLQLSFQRCKTLIRIASYHIAVCVLGEKRYVRFKVAVKKRMKKCE